ncbi:Hypothetical protein FKW44_011970 [Caligus rogercresseyi]|uniref:Uncharacterized protein n=1 Tax=Caligus rogercresseyi TaxID=217165 RepID=A0A7T8HIP9_CALRO|nr:Hypothetical protein FKW44_011970 [Caligus rogercresseyi]
MTWQGASSVAGDGTTFGSRISLGVQKIPSLNEINRHGCGSRELESASTPTMGDVVPETPLAISSSQPPKRPTRSTTSVACPLRGGTDTFASHAVVCVEQF